jgi:DNA-directed RNA polymerase subunit RPC12/RpoP
MQVLRMPLNQLLDSDLRLRDLSTKGNVLERKNVQSYLQDDETIRISSPIDGLSIDELLLKSTKAICERYKIHFAQLTTIQRKFVTNYRCSQCGLLPLYHLNLLHVKRVRCRRCGQLIAFKRKGKYGKLRKEIAFALMKEIQGDVIHALR